jgi:hypothetical protein
MLDACIFFAAVCIGTFLLFLSGGIGPGAGSENRTIMDRYCNNRLVKRAGAALIIIPVLFLLSFMLGTAV